MRSILCFILFFPFFLLSQQREYIYPLKKTKNKIQIDGQLSPEEWADASLAEPFFLNSPFDTTFASQKTEVKLLFDDQFIYIAAKCYQPRKDYRVPSLRRDFDLESSDLFGVAFDTFSDKLSGFFFGVTAFNSQAEGTMTANNVLTVWNNQWFSQTKISETFWTTEMAIPLRSLRYNHQKKEWRVNFIRKSLLKNEVSSWNPVPRNFGTLDLAYTGKLIWETSPPEAQKSNIILSPYLSGGVQSAIFREENTLQKTHSEEQVLKNVGVEARIGLGTSMNLDLTLNPDFSQVDVDRQQTNLSRFELFFPERRQFFIQNNDLFDFFGFPETRPFFSRRIGIAYNPVKDRNDRISILGGVRLSGRLSKKYRMGLMSMQTQRVDFSADKAEPSTNYSMVVLQRNIQKRSTIGAFLTNKQRFLEGLSDEQRKDINLFNRVLGLEYNFNSEDGRWEGESYYHKSILPESLSDGYTYAAFVGYNTPAWRFGVAHNYIGTNHKTEMGYTPRRGIQNYLFNTEYNRYPKEKNFDGTLLKMNINNYGVGIEYDTQLNTGGGLLDFRLGHYMFVVFKSQSIFFVSFSRNRVSLTESFDPTNISLNPNPDLKKNIKNLDIGAYHYTLYGGGYESSQRNALVMKNYLRMGEYYTGRLFAFNGEMNYRWLPYLNIGTNYSYSSIRLPEGYPSVNYWLIAPSIELSFNKSLFFSTFLQFNTQTNDQNLNFRLQWQFKPLSDLFIVYARNNFLESIPRFPVQTGMLKEYGLQIKLTYWLSV